MKSSVLSRTVTSEPMMHPFAPRSTRHPCFRPFVDCSFTEYTTLHACLRGRRGFPRLWPVVAEDATSLGWPGIPPSCGFWSIALAKMLVFVPQRSYIVRITGLCNGSAWNVLGLVGAHSVAIQCSSPYIKLVESGRWCRSSAPSIQLVRPRRAEAEETESEEQK